MLYNLEKEWIEQHSTREIIKIEHLTQAITNVVFLITCSDKSQFIFKRLNKTALTENERRNEVLVHQRAFEFGLSGKMIAVSELYCLQEYIQGESLNGAEITTENLSCLSTQLSRVHQLPFCDVVNQNLTKAVLHYCSNNNNLHDQDCFDKNLALAKQLDSTSTLDCLCHSDLSFANLVKNAKQQIYILDWEYAVRGTRAYDVGICCAINALNAQQRTLLIDEYYAKNKQQIKQDRDTFKAECEDYTSLFDYINVGWHLLHNA